jgi:hypothetical protein
VRGPFSVRLLPNNLAEFLAKRRKSKVQIRAGLQMESAGFGKKDIPRLD